MTQLLLLPLLLVVLTLGLAFRFIFVVTLGTGELILRALGCAFVLVVALIFLLGFSIYELFNRLQKFTKRRTP